ncbi:hypothetical protein WMY93_022712 [Mugilogobius chulae]|uniref:UPAR/Ly6 domain-containing protein n=1 Tax=Mugilogobius chulae TaxID=88201 RepID=A0AAW0NIB3_9GOBI
MLRAVAGAVLLCLLLCQGEALRCNVCSSRDSTLCTNPTAKFCSPKNRENACGSVVVTSPSQFTLRSCMNLATCQAWFQRIATKAGQITQASVATTSTSDRSQYPDKMLRAVTGAVLLCLLICQGEALRCNVCSSRGSTPCTNPLHEFTLRSCMNLATCQAWVTTPEANNQTKCREPLQLLSSFVCSSVKVRLSGVTCAHLETRAAPTPLHGLLRRLKRERLWISGCHQSNPVHTSLLHEHGHVPGLGHHSECKYRLLQKPITRQNAESCSMCFPPLHALLSRRCSQTCSITENACGAVIVTQPVQFSIRSCMNMAGDKNPGKSMKAVLFSVLFLLALRPGEGLKCRYCYSKSSDLCDPTSIQTCSVLNNACGDVIVTQPMQYSFRSCMNMAVCQGWITTPGAFATCCSSDLCN